MKEVKNPVGRPRKITKTTADEIVIESNIPMPGKFGIRTAKYPFKKMKIGDSFYFEGMHRTTIYQYAKSFAKRNNLSWKFATRQENKGHRIWRIK
jgi:hypothetical protein